MKAMNLKLTLWTLSLAFCFGSVRGFSSSDGTAGSVPMPSQQDDRAGQQNGASAMALAASAMQQVMAMKMMADAVASGDSEKMAMASMLMAQAAANAANAAQNKDGAKKVTPNSQMPSAPSFEKPNLDTQPKPDNFNLAFDTQNTKDSSKNETKKEDAPLTFNSNEESAGEKNSPAEKKPSSTDGAALAIPDIKPGPSNTIELKNPSNDLRPGLLAGATSFSSLGNSGSLSNLPNQSVSKSNEASDSNETKKGASKNPVSAAGAEAGTMEDLMARYMNAGAGFGGFSGASAGGGTIDLAFGLQLPGQRPKTIFEFASEQYQQARTSGKALGRRPFVKKIPSRQITSE